MIRSKYVQILLKQDMAFFDTYGSRGSIVSQVSNDALLVQYVLSEKVRMMMVHICEDFTCRNLLISTTLKLSRPSTSFSLKKLQCACFFVNLSCSNFLYSREPADHVHD